MAPEALQLPALRAVKRLSSVEASCRLDAIASAGFGLSRSKVSQQIRAGKLRLNWEPVRQASRDLQVGDCLQLQDRGSVEVLSLTLTKRDRWRVDMERR
ncbi:MAG: photosystem II S4 domain protein, partial [Synechococcaceae bacterium WB9_4xB_025]|nr:photosystem II S4 domain protein [Synechococcaceae bacterium WB9_4xB_025]